jgi:hypothetical protein
MIPFELFACFWMEKHDHASKCCSYASKTGKGIYSRARIKESINTHNRQAKFKDKSDAVVCARRSEIDFLTHAAFFFVFFSFSHSYVIRVPDFYKKTSPSIVTMATTTTTTTTPTPTPTLFILLALLGLGLPSIHHLLFHSPPSLCFSLLKTVVKTVLVSNSRGRFSRPAPKC